MLGTRTLVLSDLTSSLKFSMASLTDYFLRRDADLPRPRYQYGDRVFARLGPVPLVGMVIREVQGTVLVHSDLPVRVEEQVRHIVSVPVKTVSRLVEIK